ncbi:MAG: alpha/beta fold hydrolase [Cyclobacteriaceae bacterium]
MKNLIILIVLSLLHSVATFGQAKPWSDPSAHKVSFVDLEPGVKLEVLDWGGDGEPVLFLAGLGNSAHVFDNFTHHFTKDFHVIGLTRRGYGASSQPKYGYNVATLAKDILGVLDSLHIEKVSLVGHSIAGDEMSKFASQYPQRINKLVYLDAAYDRSQFVDLMQKAPYPPQAQPVMSQADSASALQVSAYLSRMFGFGFPESEVRATRKFSRSGRLNGMVTPDKIGIKIILGLEPPAYDQIKCPTMAVYAVFNHINELFPNYETFDQENKQIAHRSMEVLRPYLLNQIDKFQREVDQGQVVKFSWADHFVFLTHEKEVVREIKSFLLK